VKILFFGRDAGNNTLRIRALDRLGHEVTVFAPEGLLPESDLLSRALHHLGYRWVQRLVLSRLEARLARAGNFDAAIVIQQPRFGPAVVRWIRDNVAPVACYINDDPFGNRHRRQWRELIRAVPEYDLLAVVREPNVGEAERLGARRVLRIYLSADDELHRPRALGPAEVKRWSSDVLFVGSWLCDRGPFLAQLVRAGIPLSIFGHRWQRAPEWPVLAASYRGGHLDPDDYCRAILGAKIALCLLVKENRDEYTRRTMEIPALGRLLLAPRTAEHQRLYHEGEEAFFFSGVEECIRLCRTLLQDESRRRAVARAGHDRCLRNGHYNEPVMSAILQQLVPNAR
jgi:spore maturation protein CgeB